jgi:hypothetical protein
LGRHIVLLTDGGVKNTDAVLAFVQQQYQSKGTQHYAIGVGKEVDHRLVTGIAQNGTPTTKSTNVQRKLRPA